MSSVAQPAGVFIHPHALCESLSVGAGTRIWAFAHVLSGAQLGRDCNVCDHVFVENDVVVGDRVTIKCGVQLWDGVRLGNDVFVGPNATFTNDRFPRSKRRPEKFLETIVEDDASIGANATILPGISIGRAAMVGAGAVVTKNVPANAVVVGNPATITGYQAQAIEPLVAQTRVNTGGSDRRRLLGVGDCALWSLRDFADMRGKLTAIEFLSRQDLPFVPQRIFLVHDVPNRRVRGEHAHRTCGQFLIAVTGRLDVLIDDGDRRAEVSLENSATGLYVSPMVWAAQYRFEPETVLLVLASHPYDDADYVREYSEFRKLVANAHTGDVGIAAIR